MGKQVVQRTVITDDVDGTELPDDTQPVTLVHEGKTYSLFLSDENRQALLDTLDRYTKNVEPVTITQPRKSKKRTRRSSVEVAQEKQQAADKKAQRSEIQSFAKKKFPDYKFPDRAAIKREVVDAFYKANPTATKHYN